MAPGRGARRRFGAATLVAVLALAGCNEGEPSATEPARTDADAVGEAEPRTAAMRRLVDAQLPAVPTRTLDPTALRRRWSETGAPVPIDGVVFNGPSSRTTVLRFDPSVNVLRVAKRAIRLGRRIQTCGPYLSVTEHRDGGGFSRAPEVQRPIGFSSDHGACEAPSADLVT
ncbi:hypothetical protein HJD18_16160 [Thermoleophilia bacterium SCSIO 60948]|nr:hypothetical protein HJD18_16160 [Thermoleophilia bacterium SCSIO 60948]